MLIRPLFCDFTVHTSMYLDPIDSVHDTPLTTRTLQSIVTRLKHLCSKRPNDTDTPTEFAMSDMPIPTTDKLPLSVHVQSEKHI